MPEIKFVGDFSGFMFLIDEKIWEVHMNAKGYLVMTEPNVIVGEYDTYEEFAAKHPEFAETMVQVIQHKMNETIQMVNELQFHNQCPDILPHPNAVKPDDAMFSRAYQ